MSCVKGMHLHGRDWSDIRSTTWLNLKPFICNFTLFTNGMDRLVTIAVGASVS